MSVEGRATRDEKEIVKSSKTGVGPLTMVLYQKEPLAVLLLQVGCGARSTDSCFDSDVAHLLVGTSAFVSEFDV